MSPVCSTWSGLVGRHRGVEWVPGSSLSEVAQSGPSPIGAARAVRALAAAAEAAHRSGGALSIDHPSRIRISSDGNAVLAFPGTLAGDDKASDVRGLGAVLYALLLDRWPLDAATGSEVITTADTTEQVGGLDVAEPDKNGVPSNRSMPARGYRSRSRQSPPGPSTATGASTAATVQQVLDQATVVDLKTDLLPAIDGDLPPVSVTARKAEPDPGKRNLAVLIGLGLAVLFMVLAIVAWATGIFGGDDGRPTSTRSCPPHRHPPRLRTRLGRRPPPPGRTDRSAVGDARRLLRATRRRHGLPAERDQRRGAAVADRQLPGQSGLRWTQDRYGADVR